MSLDDWDDDKKITARLTMLGLKKSTKKVIETYKTKAKNISHEFKNLRKLEEEK